MIQIGENTSSITMPQFQIVYESDFPCNRRWPITVDILQAHTTGQMVREINVKPRASQSDSGSSRCTTLQFGSTLDPQRAFYRLRARYNVSQQTLLSWDSIEHVSQHNGYSMQNTTQRLSYGICITTDFSSKSVAYTPSRGLRCNPFKEKTTKQNIYLATIIL